MENWKEGIREREPGNKRFKTPQNLLMKMQSEWKKSTNSKFSCELQGTES